MRTWFLASLTGMLLLPFLVSAQLPLVGGSVPVIDAANLTRNTVTSIQSTITAVEAVFQSGEWILDLTPLEGIDIASDYGETMGQLQELAAEGAALIGDAGRAEAQFGALFGLEMTPRTPPELQQRMNEVSSLVLEARTYAIRVQTLISNLTSAAEHLTNIVSILGELTGNLSGHQSTAQLTAQLNQTLATQTAQAAAHQRADVLQQAARSLVAESFARIEADRWVGWPTW